MIKPETENEASASRNSPEMVSQRLRRANIRKNSTIIDFGCGDFSFVDQVAALGHTVIGIDQDTKVQLKDIGRDAADAIFCVEVIEHLERPAEYLREFYHILKPMGRVYIETTFAESIDDPWNHPYVSERIGHRTILSSKGLELLAIKAGFQVTWVNDNVAILWKD